MTNKIKICGLSTVESVQMAQQEGASHLGFIFFEKSPRHVSPAQAAKLVGWVQEAQTVAVTVNADDAMLDDITQVMKPDLLQLHGGESVERVRAVRQKYRLPVIKAFAVRAAEDLDKIKTYEGGADFFLLDAKPPVGADLPGGNGVRFDWSLVAGFKTTTPVFLSGGIDLANVKEAMQTINNRANALCGLDISSGVEATPGVKDNLKIKAFLQACRSPVAFNQE